jgi:hypothetical protein
VRVSKKLAIFGFNLCASIFLGLSIYGILIYLESGSAPSGSLLSSGLFAGCILVCIAGVGYFGSQWDRRNAEETRDAKATPAPGSGKAKRR